MPEKSEGAEILTIRVSKQINEQLAKFVKSNKYASKSELIRTGIIEYLANHLYLGPQKLQE